MLLAIAWLATLVTTLLYGKGIRHTLVYSVIVFGGQAAVVTIIVAILAAFSDSIDIRSIDIIEYAAIIAAIYCMCGIAVSNGIKWMLGKVMKRPGFCKCGYPTCGLPGPHCPECGRGIK